MKQSLFKWGIAPLAVCAFALAAIGSVKNPVTRPHRNQGDIKVVINVSDGTYTLHDVGVGTHAGRYDNYGAGYFDAQGNAIGAGAATVANGDTFTWVGPGPSGQFHYTGGTGRFENISGTFIIVSQTEPVVTFPDANTMVQTYSYIAEGTLTY